MSPYRILVVDDNSATRALIRLILEGGGYAVLEATDGASALQVFRNHTVHLVILDLILPDDDGLDVAARLRQEPGGEEIPLLAVSAHSDPLAKARASSIAIQGFLEKPLDSESLLLAVQACLPDAGPVMSTGSPRRRVLLVDDDPVQRKILHLRLQRAGYQVECCVDGEDALASCRRSPPDAIVADALMPRRDGFSLCLAVRLDPALRGIPFVLISSHYLEERDRVLAHKAGANAYVVRSADLAPIVESLDRALRSCEVPTPTAPPGEIVAEHAARQMAQFDRQLRLNDELTRRCGFLQGLLSVQAAMAEALAEHGEMSDLLDSALSRVLNVPEVKGAAVFLHALGGGLMLRAVAGIPDSSDFARVWVGAGPLLRAMSRNESVHIPSAADDDSIAARLLPSLAAPRAVITPLSVASDRPIGALLLALRHERLPEEFSSFLRSLRGMLVQAVVLAESREERKRSERLEAFGRLAGGIAHDFNNLLTVILGQASLIREAVPPDHGISARIDDLLQVARRGTRLTRQLLSGRRKSATAPNGFPGPDAIAALLPVLGPILGDGISVATDVEPDSGTIVMDREQFEQVVVNLAINARDAMPKGGTLTLRMRRIRIDDAEAEIHSNLAPGGYVLLSVQDTGTGIPREIRPRLFEPFFSTKGADRGTGLGLTIVLDIVRQCGGHIEVDSPPGQGTTFRVYLPGSPAIRSSPRPGKTASPATGGNDKTILLVQEDDMMLRMARRALEGAGYRVLAAAGEPEALRLVEQSEYGVDLLVTGAILPGGSGRELVEHLAAGGHAMPVVYMSSYGPAGLARWGALAAGALLLQSPFRPEDLIRAAREALSSRTATPGDGGSAP